jgi:hypothetical protein
LACSAETERLIEITNKDGDAIKQQLNKTEKGYAISFLPSKNNFNRKQGLHDLRLTALPKNEAAAKNKKKIEWAQKKFVALKRANGQPRYLVPALRLAYEQKMRENKPPEEGWEEKLNRCFLNSVTEPSSVANLFS